MIISGIILKEALRTSGITQEFAAKRLGISRQTLSTWCGRSALGDRIVRSVKTKLSIDLTKIAEDGTNAAPNPRLEAQPLHIASDPNDFDNDGSRFEELPDGTLRMRVPIVPYKAFAGYLRGFQDPEYYEDLMTISIDVFKQHKGHYLAFEVKGDSMTSLEPGNFKESIFDGSIAVGRELSRHQWMYKLHTHNYDAWVIVHKTEGILIKKIINHDVDKGFITIHSLNPDKSSYPDEDLFLDDIEQIFNIVQIVNKR